MTFTPDQSETFRVAVEATRGAAPYTIRVHGDSTSAAQLDIAAFDPSTQEVIFGFPREVRIDFTHPVHMAGGDPQAVTVGGIPFIDVIQSNDFSLTRIIQCMPVTRSQPCRNRANPIVGDNTLSTNLEVELRPKFRRYKGLLVPAYQSYQSDE